VLLTVVVGDPGEGGLWDTEDFGEPPADFETDHLRCGLLRFADCEEAGLVSKFGGANTLLCDSSVWWELVRRKKDRILEGVLDIRGLVWVEVGETF
jgi:hypothetical protein